MFCYCNIQYDPYQEQDSMFQCIGCEDWFHQACIGIKDNDFEEYICSACFEKFDFLACYVGTNGYIGRLPLEINKSCSKPTKIELESTLDRKGIFCLLDWRESLCKCLNCIEIYNSMDAAFVEKETTLEFAIDECQGANTVDLGMKALEQMDRVKAIQSIEHYNDMKNDLMKYLKSFSSIVSLMKQTIKW
jgi:E3 ubiquitin-protein ligase UBR7